MKLRSLIATLCLFIPLAAFADEPSPSRLQAAKELFQTMNSGANLDQAIAMGVESQIAASPELVPVADIYRKFVSKYVSSQTLEPRLAEAYAARFTEAELHEIIAFYKTPTGQKWLAIAREEATKRAASNAAQGPPTTQSVQKSINEMAAGKFTESELSEMRAFHQSPLGRKLAVATPELTQKVLTEGQKTLQEHFGEFREAVQKKLKEDKSQKH